ncbi:HEAT repeat domain-containing protein [Planctomyces sp. SH-PL14]|uniref:HEAT repeat domain-containing protein n=1 Tax=Planctomyces sp. SH-PL14 TaxID=1632864 RepID=UPI00078D0CBA|nr:HEAT repeat domain-containing protein [Planctomyces sp. SH-PL14]AMV19751.1 hypothetical protein VT03_17775 [Planctomyces sp. SH-PL14]
MVVHLHRRRGRLTFRVPSGERAPFSLLLSVLLFLSLLATTVRAADPAKIERAIQQGRMGLKGLWAGAGPGGRRTLAAMALLKSGEPHGGEVEKKEIESIRGKIKDGVYSPSTTSHEAIYTAGVDAMFVAELEDHDQRKELIEPIAKYLLAAQRENGSFDYMEGAAEGRNTNGDTSVTQYGCLGLWAAARCEVEIEPGVWQKLIGWHAATVRPDGMVAYTPFPAPISVSPQMSVNSLASMHIAILFLNPPAVTKLLSGTAPPPRPEVPKETKRYGFLEPVPLEVAKKKRPVVATRSGTDLASQACQKVFQALLPKIKQPQFTGNSVGYYLYSLERMAALSNRKDFDGYDWYQGGADLVIPLQGPSGIWSGQYGDIVETSFVMLFLVRATAKTLDLAPPEEVRIGGGLLAGGRGLPDNLKAPPPDPKKRTSPLGDLLSTLEKADLKTVEETQTELVEQIQLGDRKELIGKTDQILKLLTHPDGEVRRTAVWALGRTNDLLLARHLVRALDDKDPGVAVEAHNALCWITRNPTAFDLPQDPQEEVPEGAPAEARTAAVLSWKRRALLAWGEWYLAHRPFKERGDAFETWLRERIRQLR